AAVCVPCVPAPYVMPSFPTRRSSDLLMAGLVLHRRGVNSLVIDGKSGPTRESRAIVVQARSMEIYDQLGLAEQVLAGANPAGRLRIAPDPSRAEGADQTDLADADDADDAGADFGAAQTG